MVIAGFPTDAPQPPIVPPIDGFLLLDREKFADSFAADLPACEAAFMADSQVPWGVEALDGTVSGPAWRSKPSWYLIVTDDRMIPPHAQRAMAERAGAATTEVPGSHASYVSQPSAVDLVACRGKDAPHRRRSSGRLSRRPCKAPISRMPRSPPPPPARAAVLAIAALSRRGLAPEPEQHPAGPDGPRTSWLTDPDGPTGSSCVGAVRDGTRLVVGGVLASVRRWRVRRVRRGR